MAELWVIERPMDLRVPDMVECKELGSGAVARYKRCSMWERMVLTDKR